MSGSSFSCVKKGEEIVSANCPANFLIFLTMIPGHEMRVGDTYVYIFRMVHGYDKRKVITSLAKSQFF